MPSLPKKTSTNVPPKRSTKKPSVADSPVGRHFETLGTVTAQQRRGTAVVAVTVLLLLFAIYGYPKGLSPVWLWGYVLERVPTDGLPLLDQFTNHTIAVTAIIPGLLVALLAVRFIAGRSIGSLHSVVGRVRWGWFCRCLLISLAVLLSLQVLLWILHGDQFADWIGIRTVATAGVALVLATCISAWAQEVLFRGLFLQALGGLRAPKWITIRRKYLAGFSVQTWLATLAQALVFAYMHNTTRAVGAATLITTGVIFGFLVIRTGGLEAAIAYHMASNALAMFNEVAFWRGTEQAPIDQTAADLPLASALFFVGQLVIAASLIYARATESRVQVTQNPERDG